MNNQLISLLLLTAAQMISAPTAPAAPAAPATGASYSQDPVPALIQQMIQEMNRQGATFDMPPVGPNIYDKLNDQLASVYTASSQST